MSTHSDKIKIIIDRVLDRDRDPLDNRAERCIILENTGSKSSRIMFISSRAAGIHV